MSRKAAIILAVCVAVVAAQMVSKFEEKGTSLKNSRQATLLLIEQQ